MGNFTSDACWRLIPGLHISPCWILIFTLTFSFISSPTYRVEPLPQLMWNKWECVINYAAICHNHRKPDKHRCRDIKAITPACEDNVQTVSPEGKREGKKKPTCIHPLHYSAISSSFIRTWHFNLFHSSEAETLKAFCQLKCVSDPGKKKGGIKKTSDIYMIHPSPVMTPALSHRHLLPLLPLSGLRIPTCIIFSNTFHMLTVGT